MEKFLNQMLINDLKKLNNIEQNKSKIVTILFLRKANEIKKQKIDALENNILNQAEFYSQNIDDYNEIYKDIINKYSSQLSQIINIYIELFINIQMELQEAECNQKITITNLKKSIDLKNKLPVNSTIEEIEKCNKKISACIQKKMNYDIIIENCEKELDQCSKNMIDHINYLFGDKSSQVLLKSEVGFKGFINRFINRFIGANKFKNYVIEPTNIEVETMNQEIPKLSADILDKTISFVAKIKQAKDETNNIFDKMIV